MYDLSGVSFPDLRRWLGGTGATEDLGVVSCESECGGWGLHRTSWNRPERGGMGGLGEGWLRVEACPFLIQAASVKSHSAEGSY